MALFHVGGNLLLTWAEGMVGLGAPRMPGQGEHVERPVDQGTTVTQW